MKMSANRELSRLPVYITSRTFSFTRDEVIAILKEKIEETTLDTVQGKLRIEITGDEIQLTEQLKIEASE